MVPNQDEQVQEIITSEQIEKLNVQMQKMCELKERQQIFEQIKSSECIFKFHGSTMLKGFYFIAQKLNLHNFIEMPYPYTQNQGKFSLQMLYLYALNLMSPFLKTKYNIIIDCTAGSLFDMTCLALIIFNLILIIPEEGQKKIDKIFILNPSSQSKIALKVLTEKKEEYARLYQQLIPKVQLCDSIQKLTQHIQDCSVALPLETKRFIDTISIVYTNLVFKSGNFVEDKQTYKGIIAQNANGIIIMYPVRTLL